jgi:ATP-binding cassette subfamily B protein
VRLARGLRRRGVRLALLDEPFRGLEARQRGRLLAAARRRWRGATLLYVTHSPAEALGFGRMVILEEGRVAEDGSPALLAARAGSRFAGMLAAEARVAAVLGGPGWRRVRLADGRLTEEGGGAGVRGRGHR